MNKVLTLTFFCSLLFSCTNKAETDRLNEQLSAANEELSSLKDRRTTEEMNKKIVMDFYQKFFGDKDFEAAERYIGDVYIQHNPAVGDGREALVEAAKVWLKDAPQRTVNINMAIAEKDLVFVQIISERDGNRYSTMDVFRVTDGKISEHWDAFASFSKEDESANDNPLF